MRIFQVISNGSNQAIDNSKTWYRNLYEPLLELGHDVYLFSSNEKQRTVQLRDPTQRDSFSQKLFNAFMEEHSKKPFDLFFSYFTDSMVNPASIDEIRKLGVPTCNFSCNNAHQFHLVAGISPHFDYNLHSEKNVSEKFKSVKANSIWWPMASNPKFYHPKRLERNIDVSFVGTSYSLRAKYIYHLLGNKINVHAFGPGWDTFTSNHFRHSISRLLDVLRTVRGPKDGGEMIASSRLYERDIQQRLQRSFPRNVHGPISDSELINLYSKSRFSLGFLEMYDKHDASRGIVKHLHLRDFEAPMCGACYITGYSDELAEMFEPDREVIVYEDSHELLSKVKYFLRNESEAENIRRAGRKRALRDHTYQRRFEQLFDKLGLK